MPNRHAIAVITRKGCEPQVVHFMQPDKQVRAHAGLRRDSGRGIAGTASHVERDRYWETAPKGGMRPHKCQLIDVNARHKTVFCPQIVHFTVFYLHAIQIKDDARPAAGRHRHAAVKTFCQCAIFCRYRHLAHVGSFDEKGMRQHGHAGGQHAAQATQPR